MRQEELRAHNKERVLYEALKCFYEDGIERTKVSLIAQKADVTSMSVYRYYGDKENIVLETSKLFWRLLGDEVLCDADGNQIALPENGFDRVEALLRRYIDAYHERPQALLLMQDFDLYIGKRKYFDNRSVNLKERDVLTVPLKEAVAAGQADGSIKQDIDPDTTGDLLFNMLLGMLLRITTLPRSTSDEDKQNLEAQIEQVVTIALDYIKK